LTVNLEVPMVLTRLLLPGMLKRGCGHVVNMSSLAGKSGPGYQEPYAATKAGLIAFTSSLRGTYHGSGFSASVICPGFVEAGIYTRLKEKTGLAAPALLGTSRPEPVARAVVRCLRKDLPEAIINPLPVRPLFALTALAPSLGAWIMRKIGAHEFFRTVHVAQQKAAGQATAAAPSQPVSPASVAVS
ncbi:MAG TPA: SDR family NAD(P)-dependent oxidoreductase, partial [Candidatus Saccharimonadales bacterium]|nr:SDR family NAD(P)-dependent oxidoreductase [Candidatus Saccharimonadales bacterium]